MTWFQLWTICWQAAVFLTPVIVGCAVFWLNAKFVTKGEFTAERNRIEARLHADSVERNARYEALKEKQVDHDARIRLAESDIARPPSRHQLNNALSTVQAGMHALGRSVDELRHQSESRDNDLRRVIETLNSYVHTLMEKRLS